MYFKSLIKKSIILSVQDSSSQNSTQDLSLGCGSSVTRSCCLGGRPEGAMAGESQSFEAKFGLLSLLYCILLK